MSYVGQPVRSPLGFRGLHADRTYHFLGRSSDQKMVTLCFFSSSPLSVHVDKMAAATFEEGLVNDLIVLVDKAPKYPPWVAPYVDKPERHFSTAMSFKRRLEKNYDLVEKRSQHIEPLVNEYRDILSSSEPFAIINKHARKCVPRQHPARVRLWFYSYICFGMNESSLLPDTCKNGRWNRDETKPKRKYGRKNKATGEFSGHSGSTELTEKCIKGYDKHKKLSTFKKMYDAAMYQEFGCRGRCIDEKHEVYHPEDQPFPTYHQFMRRVYKKYGREKVRAARYGAARQRRKEQPITGKFTEHCSDLMERVEADGYYVSTTLKGLNGELAPPMCVVRIVDVTSGLRVGIGCSLNGEKAEAYKMALFCMGIPKDTFCSYFGISIKPEEWPSSGYPLSYILDRGPGTKLDLWQALSKMVPHIEMTPAGSGQSKAGVESSNPRNTNKEGKVEHRISNLNYFDYFKHEILETIADNKRSDITGRQTLKLIDDYVKPRPIHLWNYLDRRLRNASFEYDFQTVAEAFLEQRQFKITRAGAHLDFLAFTSDELRESGLCHRISGNAAIAIDGLILPMTIRQVWISLEDRLIECNLTQALLGDDSELNCTVKDLERIVRIRRNLETEARKEDVAIALEIAQAFEESTGRSPFGGTTQAQRPRRKTPEAMDELAAMQRLFGRRASNGN